MKAKVLYHVVTAEVENNRNYGYLVLNKCHSCGQQTYILEKHVSARDGGRQIVDVALDTHLRTISQSQLQKCIQDFRKENDFIRVNSIKYGMRLDLYTEIYGFLGYSFTIHNSKCCLNYILKGRGQSVKYNSSVQIRSTSFRDLLISANNLLKREFNIEFNLDTV